MLSAAYYCKLLIDFTSTLDYHFGQLLLSKCIVKRILNLRNGVRHIRVSKLLSNRCFIFCEWCNWGILIDFSCSKYRYELQKKKRVQQKKSIGECLFCFFFTVFRIDVYWKRYWQNYAPALQLTVWIWRSWRWGNFGLWLSISLVISRYIVIMLLDPAC